MKIGPFTAGGHAKMPHLLPTSFFEERTVAIGLAVQFGVTRIEVFHAYVQVELPGDVADALVVVWPTVERENRLDALRRLARRA